MGTLHGISVLDRFMVKIDRSAGPTGCWNWTAAVQSKGYGVFTSKQGVRDPVDPSDVGCWLAHRFAFERIGGGILDPDLTLDHLCENKLCVNPSHLEQVTREENVRRHYNRSA